MALAAGVSPGLRVNPQCSVIDTDIYNPALPGSRFGVVADVIGRKLPDGVEGLHFHALCESTSLICNECLRHLKVSSTSADAGEMGQYGEADI